MRKSKILYFTDCYIFGGCEKPIFEVMTSERFRSLYEPLLIYRKNEEYFRGMRAIYPQFPVNMMQGVRFPELNTWHLSLSRKYANNPWMFKVVNRLAWLFYRANFPLIFIYEYLALSLFFLFKRADIIHINNGGYPGALSCRIAALAAKSAGIKKIIFNVNNISAENPGVFDRWFDRLVGKCVTVFITGSMAARQALIDNTGFDGNKVLNIYHGVKPIDSIPAKHLDQQNKDDNFILMVANFEKRKGHSLVIYALRELISQNPQYADVKLFLIGDGPTQANIREIVADKQLKNNVVFLGPRSDYLNYLASCLFLINPSLGNEDLPLIILEAMSFGKAVIGTNVAGIPEEIDHGISGIVIPPGNVDELAKAMRALLSNHELRNTMGKAAQKRFYDKFIIDGMLNNYLNVYGSFKMPNKGGRLKDEAIN